MRDSEDAVEQLRAADPYPSGADREPTPKTSFDAHFKEITMLDVQEPRTTKSDVTHNARLGFAGIRPGRQRSLILASVVAVVAVGASIVTSVTAPSAAVAQVIDAAKSAASYDSGVITYVGEFRELPPGFEEEEGTWVTEFIYDGDNYQLVDNGQFIAAKVGQSDYIRVEDIPELVQLPAGSADDPFQQTRPNVEAATEDFIVDLLKSSEDFSEVASTDGQSTFRGTIHRDELREMKADEVAPSGLEFIVGEDAATLPETVGIQAVVADGIIRELAVVIEGEAIDGYVDVSITTTFTQLGEAEVEEPSADNVYTLEEQAADTPPVITETWNTIREVETRRPDICQDEVASFSFREYDGSVSVEEMKADGIRRTEEIARCMADNGEPEAAAAYRKTLDPIFEQSHYSGN